MGLAGDSKVQEKEFLLRPSGRPWRGRWRRKSEREAGVDIGMTRFRVKLGSVSGIAASWGDGDDVTGGSGGLPKKIRRTRTECARFRRGSGRAR